MLLDHMEYVAASDADSIVWIFLFSLFSSFMLSDLFAANGYSSFLSLCTPLSLSKVDPKISHKPPACFSEPHS